MTAKDISCYRINYDPADWEEIAQERGPLCVAIGAVHAIKTLCDEVVRLKRQLKKLGK